MMGQGTQAHQLSNVMLDVIEFMEGKMEGYKTSPAIGGNLQTKFQDGLNFPHMLMVAINRALIQQWVSFLPPSIQFLSKRGKQLHCLIHNF